MYFKISINKQVYTNFDGTLLYTATSLLPYISGAHKGLVRLEILSSYIYTISNFDFFFLLWSNPQAAKAIDTQLITPIILVNTF